jgi:hypothetical protein
MVLSLDSRVGNFLKKEEFKKKIPWKLIKCEGKIGDTVETRVCWEYFFRDLPYNDLTIESIGSSLLAIRKEIREFTYPRVKETIAEAAHGRGLINKGGQKVRTYSDLCTYWKDVTTEDGCRNVWNCVVGVFELRRSWKLDMESQILDHFGWEYDQDTVCSSGTPANSCIIKIISRVINDLRKNINDLKTRHSFDLRVKRRPEDINDYNRKKRRKKGEFVPCNDEMANIGQHIKAVTYENVSVTNIW